MRAAETRALADSSTSWIASWKARIGAQAEIDALSINFHPRVENFDYSEYRGAVAVAANLDPDALYDRLVALSKSEYGALKYFKPIAKRNA